MSETPLVTFIKDSTAVHFMEFQQWAASFHDYAPYSQFADNAMALMNQNDFEKARDHLCKNMNAWISNPGFHMMLSFCAHRCNDQKTANMEMMLHDKILKGILSTGNGTLESPYVVTSTSDEYDVLKYLKKNLKQQSLINKNSKAYDKIETDDGTEIWFDITIPFGHL